MVSRPPCIVHEDEHLLVAAKPSGLNTHSPAPYAGEGFYEWLRHREPRWENLATIHRLDKVTSGIMVFAKTKLANKSLTEQFAGRAVHKRYVLLTAQKPAQPEFTVRSHLARVGERYLAGNQGDFAETRFRYLRPEGRFHLLQAEPLTGRTHQIRAHCEFKGFPIVGDALYGGERHPRVCLHSEELTFQHPATGAEVTFRAPVDFTELPTFGLRRLLIEPEATNACRLLHGASDGSPFYLEQWGDYLLAQSEGIPDRARIAELARLQESWKCRAVYHKALNRQVARTAQQDAAPRLIAGEPAPRTFAIRENGAQFEISFEQGYSVGLFLDQRDNRRRLLANHIAAGFPVIPGGLAGRTVLNTFAYTCGFSVCAALAGAHVTSLDLSRKYLDWGQRNFQLNGLNPAEPHDFIYGDVFDWAPRLLKKNRFFDVIILDPPTFSRSKTSTFQAERDYPALLIAVLPLLKPGGVLLACTNSRRLPAETFLTQLAQTAAGTGHAIRQQHYAPQPPDHPVSREEPAYLKAAWMRLDRASQPAGQR